MNQNAVIGISFGGKTLVAGKVKDGRIEKSIVRVINNKALENEILTEVFNVINEVKDDEIAGIGIGVPGIVDVEKGIVYDVQTIPSWHEVHIKEILESHFGLKVYVNNDANCFYLNDAFFEYKYGVPALTFLNRAKRKDKIARAIFEYYGFDLGNLIKTILYTVDPEIITIGGPLSKAFPYFEKSMWKKIKTFKYKQTINKLQIVASKQDDIAVLGAAALYYDAQNQRMKK